MTKLTMQLEDQFSHPKFKATVGDALRHHQVLSPSDNQIASFLRRHSSIEKRWDKGATPLDAKKVKLAKTIAAKLLGGGLPSYKEVSDFLIERVAPLAYPDPSSGGAKPLSYGGLRQSCEEARSSAAFQDIADRFHRRAAERRLDAMIALFAPVLDGFNGRSFASLVSRQVEQPVPNGDVNKLTVDGTKVPPEKVEVDEYASDLQRVMQITRKM